MILYKVYYKKYTKDEPKLIGSERVNDQGNWECNLMGSPDWNSGVISLQEGQGSLERKVFVMKDAYGDLMFEGDEFEVENGPTEMFQLNRQISTKTSHGYGDSSISMIDGWSLGWNYGDEEYKIKLRQDK